MKSTLAEPTTQILTPPCATLTYDVRRHDETTEPPLFLIGSPMAPPASARLPATSLTGRS